MTDENRTAAVMRPIGIVHTPFVVPEGTPIQPVHADDAPGEVVLDPEFASALDDLDGFERVWLLTWLDRADAYRLKVVPYRDTELRGLFATRAPCRPNAIGLSVVRLVEREGRTLRVTGVDLLDGTPLLDIKPYIAVTDAWPDARAGWLDNSTVDRRVADDRFHREA